MQELHARTGTEVLMFAVRSSKEHFNKPYVWSTSDHVDDFFETTLDCSVDAFASKLETACIKGVPGSIIIFGFLSVSANVESNARVSC